MAKLKVGFYGLTGCAGCQLSVLFNEDEIISIVEMVDLRAFPFIKEVNYEEKFDYIFVEGLVASKSDLEELRKLRENSKVLVALGACAHTGCIPAYRNYTLKENYEHLMYSKEEGITDVDPTPIDTYVKVDYTIPGCPPSKTQIIEAIKAFATGIMPKPYTSPVCIECRKNGNECLLIKGKPCLGPITSGGCDSICVNGGLECWGCRGPSGDAHYPAFVTLLRHKGYSDEFIKTRMQMFSGQKIKDLEKAFVSK